MQAMYQFITAFEKIMFAIRYTVTLLKSAYLPPPPPPGISSASAFDPAFWAAAWPLDPANEAAPAAAATFCSVNKRFNQLYRLLN